MMDWEKEYKKETRTATIGNARVAVHRHIYYPKDQWLLSVYGLDFQHRELSARPIDAALSEAEKKLRTLAFEILDATGGRREQGTE